MVKGIAFSCVHHPIASKAALDFLHAGIEEFRPDVLVNLGDFYDGEGWSRWDNENEWSTHDEYVAARNHLKLLNSFTFLKKKVWLFGNHEANLQEPGRLKRSQRHMMHWKDWCPEDGGGIRQQVKDWKVIEKYGSAQRFGIGPITFTHGTKIGLNAARDEARMHSVHNGLCVSGHTHRPVQVTRDMQAGNIPADIWYANVGCLANWEKMRYIHRMNYQAWGHAYVQFEIDSRDTTLLTEGRKPFRTKAWEAEVKLLSIARDGF